MRRLAGTHDPVELHARLGAPMLFYRTGGRALILIDSAVRLEASAGEVEFTVRSEAGALVLKRIAQTLAEQIVSGDERCLKLRFERCDDPDEARRSAAPTLS